MTKLAIAKELGVARSTLYYQPRLAVKDEQLRQDILRVLHIHPSYGYRRLAIYLGINKKRALRVMQLYGIKPYRRRGKKPNYSRPPSLADSVLPNLIKDYFPISPGDVWASDFTYIPYGGRFIYLATIMDVYSREIVGWYISSRHDTALVAAAFFDALEQHGRPNILHSDRGSEYLSQIYMELATNCGISMSYSAKAHPWENGYQESFYNGFKVDLGDPARFVSLGQLIEAIHFQLYVYNHHRIHLALKMAPKQYLVKQSELLTT
jgi:transposase InsO family protein